MKEQSQNFSWYGPFLALWQLLQKTRFLFTTLVSSKSKGGQSACNWLRIIVGIDSSFQTVWQRRVRCRRQGCRPSPPLPHHTISSLLTRSRWRSRQDRRASARWREKKHITSWAANNARERTQEHDAWPQIVFIIHCIIINMIMICR